MTCAKHGSGTKCVTEVQVTQAPKIPHWRGEKPRTSSQTSQAQAENPLSLKQFWSQVIKSPCAHVKGVYTPTERIKISHHLHRSSQPISEAGQMGSVSTEKRPGPWHDNVC